MSPNPLTVRCSGRIGRRTESTLTFPPLSWVRVQYRVGERLTTGTCSINLSDSKSKVKIAFPRTEECVLFLQYSGHRRGGPALETV